jgi:hypothetical protein
MQGQVSTVIQFKDVSISKEVWLVRRRQLALGVDVDVPQMCG